MATIEDIHSVIAEMDPNLAPGSEGHRAAVLIAASGTVGSHPPDLVAFTGEHAEWVALVHERLTQSGIWHDGQVDADCFEDGVTFWLGVAVALGYIARTE